MVAAGAAWTLYIEGNLPAEVPGIAVRRLPPPDPPSNVWALWRVVGTSPQAEAFIRSLLERAPGVTRAESGRASELRTSALNPSDRVP
jgi:DNA-binding transcriptional LysR family regulator